MPTTSTVADGLPHASTHCMYLAQRHIATAEDHIPPGIDEYNPHRLRWRFLQVSTIAAIALALGLMIR